MVAFLLKIKESNSHNILVIFFHQKITKINTLTLRSTGSGIWAEAKAPSVKGLHEGQYRVDTKLYCSSQSPSPF
jgi:hypothetical protein